MILINKRKPIKTFVSIVTPTYNSEKHLDEMFQSLLKQKFKNFEVIIIDGLSEDKTLDIVQKYKKMVTFCSSEKDKGIYDAFNKGIKKANGKYIGIVNSDDLLMPNALKYLEKYDKRNPKIDFIFGGWKVLALVESLFSSSPEKDESFERTISLLSSSSDNFLGFFD